MRGTKQVNYGTPKQLQLKLKQSMPHRAPKRAKNYCLKLKGQHNFILREETRSVVFGDNVFEYECLGCGKRKLVSKLSPELADILIADKILCFEAVPANKITAEVHKFLLLVFDMDGLITNESTLSDFLDFGGLNYQHLPEQEWSKFQENTLQKIKERVEVVYGVTLKGQISYETKIWELVWLVAKSSKR